MEEKEQIIENPDTEENVQPEQEQQTAGGGRRR